VRERLRHLEPRKVWPISRHAVLVGLSVLAATGLLLVGCRHGWITKEFEEIEGDNPPIEIIGTSVRITYDELRKLVKELPFILRKVKACDAYRKCLDDRDTGKVKHCYENDRRWRKFFTGAW
jgi:hypothetical protein